MNILYIYIIGFVHWCTLVSLQNINDKLAGTWEPIKFMVNCTYENFVSIRVEVMLKTENTFKWAQEFIQGQGWEQTCQEWGAKFRLQTKNAKATLSYLQ